MKLARQITDKPLLVRLDSGNDSADNIGIFMEECIRGDKVHFIIKRNIRKEKLLDWLDKVRDACTNVKIPREGKKNTLGRHSGTYLMMCLMLVQNLATAKNSCIRTIYDITESVCIGLNGRTTWNAGGSVKQRMLGAFFRKRKRSILMLGIKGDFLY